MSNEEWILCMVFLAVLGTIAERLSKIGTAIGTVARILEQADKLESIKLSIYRIRRIMEGQAEYTEDPIESSEE